MGQAEIIVTVPEAAAESTIDRLLAAGLKDLRHGERREIPIDGYALKYPGKKIDMRTTFDTLEEVESFIKHCSDKNPATLVPLSIHSSYKGER